jgi:hypothetical protein
MGSGDRCRDSEGDSGVSEAGMLSALTAENAGKMASRAPFRPTAVAQRILHGKEAVPGSSPGEGLNICKTALFHNYRVPPESGRGRGSSRRQPRKLPANRGLVPSSRAPPCCGGPRRSGRYRVNPKSLENAKISVAAAGRPRTLGTGFGEQSVAARSRMHRMERSTAYASTANSRCKRFSLCTRARGEDRRASAPRCELRPRSSR